MIGSFKKLFQRDNPEDARRELIEVLRAGRELLARPDNDFDWSSWEGAADALSEIDGLIARVSSGDLPARLDVSVIFAPTGPMQEVSISSGWSRQFLVVAERFDKVERRLWSAEA